LSSDGKSRKKTWTVVGADIGDLGGHGAYPFVVIVDIQNSGSASNAAALPRSLLV
jgi:hypothetical protein